MADEEGGRRAKRRCARRAASTIPSAIHYVGYVEDDETPEMIMAKFQELERIQKAAHEAKARAAAEVTTAKAQAGASDGQAAGSSGTSAAGGDAGADQGLLSDEHLLEVFKQTSMFNVKTALQDNAILLDAEDMDRYDDDELQSEDEGGLRAFWSDEDDFTVDDEDDMPGGRRRNRRGAGGMRRTGSAANRLRTAAMVRGKTSMITAFNPTTGALVRRRTKVADPDDILQYRVPPSPIPLAWGRSVRPYVPQHLLGQKKMLVPIPRGLRDYMEKEMQAELAVSERCVYQEVPSIPGADFRQQLGVGPFQAVLINQGWELEGRGDAALKDLAKVPIDRLTPVGFVFVWVQKQHVQALCRLMKKWKFVYIENLTWVYLRANNTILTKPGEYVNNSHLTLYMFRKASGGKDIELRHQRNPDVTFDCLAREPETSNVGIPEEAYVAIETLLPCCKGKLLELWAPKGVRRPGWTHLVETGDEQQQLQNGS